MVQRFRGPERLWSRSRCRRAARGVKIPRDRLRKMFGTLIDHDVEGEGGGVVEQPEQLLR